MLNKYPFCPTCDSTIHHLSAFVTYFFCHSSQLQIALSPPSEHVISLGLHHNNSIIVGALVGYVPHSGALRVLPPNPEERWELFMKGHIQYRGNVISPFSFTGNVHGWTARSLQFQQAF
eukprot:TRINITY_DN112382_c0_g1_i1.p2 TRINITY_DN112382_c0_g1~~TRINITY_DN112382_c0_g1_i1.p2  ORF type:complete len:119 (+),score=3.21 TRINITY_DN112382_c0_g1_i1:253-609(+)